MMMKLRGMRGMGHVRHMANLKAYTVLVGNPVGKPAVLVHWCKWEFNTKMDLK
jgi:hypothetical protein